MDEGQLSVIFFFLNGGGQGRRGKTMDERNSAGKKRRVGLARKFRGRSALRSPPPFPSSSKLAAVPRINVVCKFNRRQAKNSKETGRRIRIACNAVLLQSTISKERGSKIPVNQSRVFISTFLPHSLFSQRLETFSTVFTNKKTSGKKDRVTAPGRSVGKTEKKSTRSKPEVGH